MARAKFTSTDPWDGSPIGEFAVATADDVREAVERARLSLRAGSGGGWSSDAAARRQVVQRAAELCRARREELARLISRETGKVLWESLLEADAMAAKVDISLRAQDERRTPTSKQTPSGAIATTYRPHGVMAVLGPFNFPGHLPWGHIVPALIAGNAVVFKPSDRAPGTGEFLASLLAQAGIPDDVFSVVQGGSEVGRALVAADVDGVCFTGSYDVGVTILRALAERPGVIPALEMGGNNPLIAWDVKNLDAAALAVVQSAYATAGQRCSCARRLIVKRQGGDGLLDRVVALASRLTVGRWDDTPPPFYGTLATPRAAEAILSAQADLVRLGADLRLPCRRSDRSPALVSPGLLVHRAPVFDLPDEELFGPLLQVIEVPTFDDALEVANSTRYGLCAGLLSDHPPHWDRFRDTARAGVLTLNRPTTGASSDLPFGGLGDSGNHRPAAYHAADYCSYPVAEMSNAKCVLPEKLPPGVVL